MFSPAGTVLPLLKAGKLRALAVSGRHRLAGLPDVPTFDEAGVKHLDFSLWFGLNTAAGTPKPVIDKLNKEVGAVLALPEVKAQLEPQMIFPVSTTAEAFGAFIREDTARWQSVVKDAGLQPNVRQIQLPVLRRRSGLRSARKLIYPLIDISWHLIENPASNRRHIPTS